MARPASKLTKRFLDGLRAKAEADHSFGTYAADSGQPGLYAWARRGRVRFVFRYRPPQGGSRRMMQLDHFGAITLEQARDAAQHLRGRLAVGVDPADERRAERREAVTVAEAVEGYLEDLRQRAEGGAKRGKRSGHASAKNRLNRHVVPALGTLRLRDVTADHVRRLHREMKRTPVEANRTLSAFSAVFGWADRRELLPAATNPCRHVERYAETGTRHAFTAEQLSALGQALEAAEGTVHPSALLAVRLLALTGFRRSEILGHTMKDRRGKREGLRWGDVDLERGLVRLHDSKSGAQTRCIGAAAVELLREARPAGAQPADPVCPGTIAGRPYVGIDKARLRLWKAAQLEGVDLHSLRHSFASIGAHAQGGRYAGHVSALLGHGYQSRSVTERYITADPEGLRPAADAIAGELARLLGLEERGRVVSFPAGRQARE